MLSYDMVFFSLLLEPDAANECTMSKKEIRRCRKKHDSSNMLYISAISVMLLYHKLENDIQDGERLKRFAQRLIVRGYKKLFLITLSSVSEYHAQWKHFIAWKMKNALILLRLNTHSHYPLQIYLLVHQTEMYLRRCGRSLLIM